MSYNKTEPQMNSHPDEIKWNGVDYVKKDFVNQEVEKRIAGVMPTKNEIGNAAQLFDKQKRPLWKEAIWRAGANWAIDIIRSRLSQKTDNLKENNNGSTN